MNLNYAVRRKWPLSLKASMFLLVVLVPVVTIGWFAMNTLVETYFTLSNREQEMMGNYATLVCRSLDRFPPMLLMLVANAGATLALANWREGAIAKVCAAAHVAVFGVSAFTFIA